MTAYYPARGSAERILGQAQGAAGHVHPGYSQHFLGDIAPPNPRAGDMWTRGGSVEFSFTDLELNAELLDDFFVYETPGGITSMRFVLPDGASDVQALDVLLSYAVADATYGSGTPQIDLILNGGTTLQVPLDGATDDLVMVTTSIPAPADWLALAENESFLDVDYATLPDEIAIYDLSLKLLRTGFVYSFDGAQWVLMSTGGQVIESHNQLIGREAINAHPIAAITDLQTELDSKALASHPHAHGTLTGLGNDDHPHYLDTTRGYTRTLANQTFVNVIGDTMTGDLQVDAKVTAKDLIVGTPDASHAAIEFQDSGAGRVAEISGSSNQIDFRAIDGTAMASVRLHRTNVNGMLNIQPIGVSNEASVTAGEGPPDNTVIIDGFGLYIDITGQAGGPLYYTEIPGDNTTWASIGTGLHDHDADYVKLADHGSSDHATLLAGLAPITHVPQADGGTLAGDLLHVQYPSLQPSDLALSSAIGVSDTIARADHVHKRPSLAELNAAAAAHTHDGSEIDTGTIAFARLPTGTTSSTVAIGNHTHAYAPTSRTISAGSGLTGGGDLTANRTLNIGAGTGISVAADSISINRTLVDSWYADSGHGHTGTDDHSHAAYSTIGHDHSAGDITSGTFVLARIPTGTSSSTVALGNHAHSGVYDPAGTASGAVSTHEGDADPHSQYQRESEKGAASGYAPLGADSIVPSIYLPAVTPTKYFNVADVTARKTLSSYSPDGLYRGDNVIQASPAATFVYIGSTEPADQTAINNDANWQELASGGVQSINGQIGTVVLDHSDVGAPPDTRTISAGNGLTGGGNLTANRTLAVGAGTGISVGATSVSINRGVVDGWYADSGHGHTGTDDHSHAAYVPTTRSLAAGAGLTGGGDLSANRTINVGAGTGISVAADAISVNRAVVDAWYAAPGDIPTAIGTHSTSNDHDSRYYTETEIDALLSGLAGGSHDHDADYVNVLGDTMTGELRITDDFSASGMVRDGSDPANYATKPGAIWIREDIHTGSADPVFDPSNYSSVSHLHTGVYSPVGHNHTGDWASPTHTHDVRYSQATHDHPQYIDNTGGTVSGDLDVAGMLSVAGMVRTSDPPVLKPGQFWVDEDDIGTVLGDGAVHTHDAADINVNLTPVTVTITGNMVIPSGASLYTYVNTFLTSDVMTNTLGATFTDENIIVPVSGYYMIHISGSYGSSSGNVRAVTVGEQDVDESTYMAVTGHPSAGATSGIGYKQAGSQMVYISAGARLTICGRQDSGADQTLGYRMSLVLMHSDDDADVLVPALLGQSGSGVSSSGPPFYSHIKRDASFTVVGTGGVGTTVVTDFDTDATPTSSEIVPMTWTPSGITIPKDGVYTVMARVQMDSNNGYADGRVILGITVDGAEQGFKEIQRGHTTNSLFRVHTSPAFYSGGQLVSVGIEVQGGPATCTINEVDLVIVSVGGAGTEYINPALAQEGRLTVSDMPSLGTGAGQNVGTVAFDVPFNDPPFVSLEQASLAAGQQYYRLVPYNVTANQFDVYVYNLHTATIDTGELHISWRAQGAAIGVTGQAWQTPVFESGWSNYSGSWEKAGYRRDPDGTVHLRGLIAWSGGTFPTSPAQVAFTLPPGYRPAQNTHHLGFARVGEDMPVVIQVMTDGKVQLRRMNSATYPAGTLAYASLSGLTFSAVEGG